MKTRFLHFRPEGGNAGGDSAADKAAADAAAAASAATGTTDDAAKAAADKAAASAAAEAAKATAITYTLTLPEKSTLDPSVVERTTATARELGLDNAKAQKLLDTLAQEATAHAEKHAALALPAAVKTATEKAIADYTKAHSPGGDEWNRQEAQWRAEALADPILGRTEQERQATIDKGKLILKKYTDARPQHAAAFKGFLETTGMGSHPAALSFLGWLGASASEGKIVVGDPSAGAGTKSAAELMYPDQAGKPGAAYAKS
jgi:hypothetical protein